jgi:hypothetical protein
MQTIGVLLAIVSAVWVYTDAKKLKVWGGVLGGGFLDMGIVAWTIVSFLLWPLGLLCYLLKRPMYAALTKAPPPPTTPPLEPPTN